MNGTVGGLVVRCLPLTHPAVEPAWRQLQEDGGVSTPFLTWQWCSGVLAEPLTAAGTAVLLVQRGAHAAGLLPLESTTRPDGLRTIGPAGWRWLAPDHLDVVAAPAEREAVARAVVTSLLKRRGWELTDLDGLAGGGALATAVRASRLRGLRHGVLPLASERVTTRYVPLQRSPVLTSASLRSQVGRGLRAAEKAGGGFDLVTDPDAVVDLLDELMRLHVERFGTSSSVFATASRRHAHQAAARAMAAAGAARIYRLRAGGDDAALLYALCHGTTISYYSSGMRPGVTASPGRTLLGLVALSAAQEGFTEFDLLRGEHDYKRRFAAAVHEDARLRLVRATARTLGVAARRAPRARVSHRRGPAEPPG